MVPTVSMTTIAYEAQGWGVGKLWLDGERVVHHELPRKNGEQPAGEHPLADDLAAYFAGEPVSFDEVEVDISWCSPFQAAVTDALRRISYGETVTYGELAALAGYPNAHRAVGTVCARNRFPLIVPCHRVLAANGFGAFGSLGTRYKERLLALEGAL